MIDIGMSYKDAKAEAQENRKRFPAIEAGDYEFSIVDVKAGTYPKGRPKLTVRFEIINDPNVKNQSIFRDYPLPWTVNGSFVNSGIGMLAELFNGCGLEWEGTVIDPTALFGAICRGKVEKVQRVDSTGNPQFEADGTTPQWKNEISRIYV